MINKSNYSTFWLIMAIVSLIGLAIGMETQSLIMGSLIMSKLYSMEKQE